MSFILNENINCNKIILKPIWVYICINILAINYSNNNTSEGYQPDLVAGGLIRFTDSCFLLPIPIPFGPKF